MQQKSIGRWVVAMGLMGILVLISPVSDLLAFRMVLMNLEELATRAPRIVAGVCTAQQDGEMVVGAKGETLAYIEYTFRVTDVIKGNVGETLTIRQVNLGRKPASGAPGLDGGTVARPRPYNPVPLPQYQVGQEVMLFLTEDSELGLTSPLGMQQGVFDVRDARGKKFVSSRFSNTSLFRGISPERTAAFGLSTRPDPRPSPKVAEVPAGPFRYEAFVSLVQELAKGH
jgi:hypothetical protein